MRPHLDPVVSALLASLPGVLARVLGEQAASDVLELVCLRWPDAARRERLIRAWRERRRWRVYRRREARRWASWLRVTRWAPPVELDGLGPLEDLRRVAA